jgi:hypothetical protein
MALDLGQLASIGELLGGIGVILSLLYLAFQLRDQSRGLRSESYGRSLDRLARMQERFAEDSDLARIYNMGLADPEGLSVEERIRFTWVCTELFGAFEYMHYQQMQGDLPEEIWHRWRETIKFWLTFPGMRVWWHCKPSPFSTEFSSFVEDCIREGYQPEHPGVWQDWMLSGAAGLGVQNDAG